MPVATIQESVLRYLAKLQPASSATHQTVGVHRRQVSDRQSLWVGGVDGRSVRAGQVARLVLIASDGDVDGRAATKLWSRSTERDQPHLEKTGDTIARVNLSAGENRRHRRQGKPGSWREQETPSSG